MRIGHLLDSQVRELREAVLASGLGERFEWEESSGDWAGYISGGALPTLVYRPDNFRFAFEYHDEIHDPYGLAHDPGGHSVFFVPGRQTPNEIRRHLQWSQVISAFREWLRYIAREKGISAPPAPTPAVPSRQSQASKGEANVPSASAPPRKPPAATGESKINQWLVREAGRRGLLWKVGAAIAGLGLAALKFFRG